MRRTKIVCTLGPASSSPETIGQLLDAGMNAVRLNFSHGTYEDHAAIVERIRCAAHDRDRMVPVIADLQGPKIRTGKLENGEKVYLQDGQRIRLTTDDVPGNAERIAVDYANLPREVNKGQRILLADGAIELRAVKVTSGEVLCEVVSGGVLGERKGVNLPGALLDIPSITSKDEADLRFALDHGVDYVAQSFVRRASDIAVAKDLIHRCGRRVPVIAKLEKPRALEQLTEILESADAVMVARGDLGVELSPWQVPIEQKRIIEEASRLRKPVITATQMLESMMEKPSPTRAEASDVANAVFDRSDALMLSGETAVGKYPVKAVEMMAKIIHAAEMRQRNEDYRPAPVQGDADDVSDAVAATAAQLAAHLKAKYVVAYTESGYTARLLSKHRPRAMILGLSRHVEVCHRMKLLWGVRAKPFGEVENLDALVEGVEKLLLELDWVRPGELICILAGTPFEVQGRTDLIKVHRVGDRES